LPAVKGHPHLLALAITLLGPLAAAQPPDQRPIPPGAIQTPAATVKMTNRQRFEPAQITVRAGDYVLWHNDSREVHTVTDDPEHPIPGVNMVVPEGAAPFDSGPIESGNSFGRVFDLPGVYRYTCTFHGVGGMVGVVTVQPASASARTGGAKGGSR
jgi:plastocyanin